jgi:CP family cyanate transporter-like MFS transporter
MTRTLSTHPGPQSSFDHLEAVEAKMGSPHNKTEVPGLSLAAAVVCIVLVAVDLRPAIVSVGPLLPMIRAEFALSNAQASLLTAIPAMLMGLLAFPTPWLAHRFGRDRVILVALAMLMAATAGRAFAGSVGLLLLDTAGVGAGIAVAGALIPGFAKKGFPKQASVLMGIYAMSLGLGSTLAAALAEPLSSMGGGWRLGSGIFALPCLTAIAAWLAVVRAERGSGLEASAQGVPARSGLPIRNPTAWLVALYVSANNFLFFGIVSWTAPIFREYGMSATMAGLVLASFTAAFMMSNPLAGLISRGDDRRVTIALFAGLALVGCVAVAALPGLLPSLFIPVIACGVGGSFTLGMILPLDNAVSAQEANAWTAFVMGIGYFAGALGPLLLGVLRDSTGSFDIPLWLLAAVALLMVVLSPFLRPHQQRNTSR